MPLKILYLLPSFNKFGGTPKKTMDLINHSFNDCFLYVWTNAYAQEFKQDFIAAGAHIYEGSNNRSFFKHLTELLKIIDQHQIQIIQSQFFFGELLAGIIKLLRPQVKLIIAFVGAMSPKGYKRTILNFIYNRVDAFIYISKYVKQEKLNVYPKLKNIEGAVIYNGTDYPVTTEKQLKKTENTIHILCVSGLSEIKNVQILIDCMCILLEKKITQVKLLIAGDGPKRKDFETQIINKNLTNHITLLGYQKNIGNLYKITDIFAHPCYIEGFGIAVAEAMIEEKPIIAANAGALPELITHQKTGLLVDPFNALEWANAVIQFMEQPTFAQTLANNAKKRAKDKFSVQLFAENYNTFYKKILY